MHRFAMPASLGEMGEKFHTFWGHLSLRGLGGALAALPLIAVISSASLAFVGNRERARTESALAHHIELVEGLGQVSTLMLNAETGLRGYLLVRQAEFLQPYDRAVQSLGSVLTSLQALIDSEPGAQPRREKRARLAAIRATVAQEMTIFARLRAGPNGANPATQELTRSKAAMDTLRAQLRARRRAEQELLAARLADIERVRRRDYLTIAATLLLGLGTRGAAFYFFNRRVVSRVAALTENVRALRQQEPAPHPPSNTRDAIGELEQELARGLPGAGR